MKKAQLELLHIRTAQSLGQRSLGSHSIILRGLQTPLQMWTIIFLKYRDADSLNITKFNRALCLYIFFS